VSPASGPSAVGAGADGDGAARLSLARINPKHLIIFLITIILVLGEWRYSILGGYERLAATLGSCLLAEWGLARLVGGRKASYSSAYVSGISLALLLKPQAGLLWPFWLGGFLAIGSKYVLLYSGRHLWNPSNFAIGALVILAPGSVAILSHQWGNEIGTNAVIWVLGLLIASRARVLHITLAYLASFAVLALLRSGITGDPLLAELAPVTGPMYQLFIFFMITDPRTTVGTRTGRIVVVALVALAEALIRLAGDAGIPGLTPLYYSPPILALFLVGPIAMWWDLRRREEARGGR
jgi:Na+-translocating ferredoxin:NAD+ oxidoreductase RnfD subunit